jgi:hypothetical protein
MGLLRTIYASAAESVFAKLSLKGNFDWTAELKSSTYEEA